ncbi:putative cytochrome P450 E-class, group I [Cercophora samala]|uniref:Cytochrome P450 E-class, group I n=1 Tax=Cercophora samala TaxID=330535 RepID=A0AA39ZK94_9PEZI|nr:putative cytochrome P450 E-class, group I [Cercophora samala]
MGLLSHLPSTTLYPGAALLGTTSHLAIFIRGEWHMQSPVLFWIYAFLTATIFAIINLKQGDHPFQTTFFITTSYSLGLFTSISIYRLYFHRLRSFPGPKLAALTKFWHVWQCRRGKNHLVIERLQAQYGNVIRTGPEELTIIDPSVPSTIDGPKSTCTKAVWYDFLLPEIALNTTRSVAEHDQRRKVWDKGFSSAAMREYDERVRHHAEILADRIESLSRQGKAVDVSDWFYFFTFDVMGEFAFGQGFEMLQSQKWHWAVRLLRRAMGLLGPFSAVPWLAQVAFYVLPWMWVVRDWLGMMEWCKERMGERIQRHGKGCLRRDVSHWLIEESLGRGTLERDREWLNGDAVTVVIAGSDTIAPTLVFAFYELVRNRGLQETLTRELEGVDIYDKGELAKVGLLTGVIKETMRLWPAVPTGGYRQTPDGGLEIAGSWVPGGVTIVSPRWSLGRSELAYERADEWIPERWTTKPEMVRDARGFQPFSQGRFNCVGKALAMAEMRFVIALLLTRFEVGFSTEERGERLVGELRDQFTASPGALELEFRVRVGSHSCKFLPQHSIKASL